MSLQERGRTSCHAKKLQSSSDILVEEALAITSREADSGEALVIGSDSIQLLHETRFVLDNNIEHRNTPTRNYTHKNFNNDDEEETQKLTFNFDRVA